MHLWALGLIAGSFFGLLAHLGQNESQSGRTCWPIILLALVGAVCIRIPSVTDASRCTLGQDRFPVHTWLAILGGVILPIALVGILWIILLLIILSLRIIWWILLRHTDKTSFVNNFN